jgi:hypothetical protein
MAALFDFIRNQNAKGKSGKRVLAFMREINQFLDFMKFEDGSIEAEIQALIDHARLTARRRTSRNRCNSRSVACHGNPGV